jgi:hypothetical protein
MVIDALEMNIRHNNVIQLLTAGEEVKAEAPTTAEARTASFIFL